MALQHLFRRNATYYFRRAVPRQFIPFFNRKEIRFSLKTTSLETAKRKIHCFNVLLDTFWAKIDQSLKINRDRTHKDGGYEMYFDNLKALLLANEYAQQSRSENRKTSEELLKSYLEKTETPDEIKKMMASFKSDHISDELYFYKVLCTRSDFETDDVKAERMAALDAGLISATETENKADTLLEHLLQAKRIKNEFMLKNPSQEDIKSFYKAIPSKEESGQRKDEVIPPSAADCQKKHQWEKLYDDYLNDPDSRGLSQSTKIERRARLKLAFQLMEINSVEDVTVDKVRDLRRDLMKYPANCTKLYSELSPKEAIIQAEKDKRKTLAVNTVNGYITALSTLCAYAVKETFLDKNPLEGHRIKKTWEELKRQKEARLPFDKTDLAKAFSTDVYPDREKDPAKFFIPLIALTQGMRLNEICQLTVDDIDVVDGINVIKIQRDERKSVKNPSSERVVPIHQKLIDLGFLDYVESRRKYGSKSQVFDCYRSSKGYYSDAFSKWYGRYKKKVGVREKVTFHSLRHTFTVKSCEANINDRMVDAMCGWSEGHTIGSDSMQMHYLNEFSLEKLYSDFSKLKFPELTGLLEKYGKTEADANSQKDMEEAK